MKSTKTLIVFNAVIYTALFSLLGLFAYELHLNNKAQMAANTAAKIEAAQIATKVVPPVTIINYGEIKIYTNPAYDPQSIDKIITARVSYNDKLFMGDSARDNAEELLSKIVSHANDYGINIKNACQLVHVESDFNEKAYHEDTSAAGLCQITNVCLTDFNKITKNSYTMVDMLDADKNLEVGFWYFARLLNDEYYGKKYNIESMKDAYLAYNCGPEYFRTHKDELNSGIYKGYKYNAGERWELISNIWTTI